MPDDREDTNLAERSLELDSIELAAAIFGSPAFSGLLEA